MKKIVDVYGFETIEIKGIPVEIIARDMIDIGIKTQADIIRYGYSRSEAKAIKEEMLKR